MHKLKLILTGFIGYLNIVLFPLLISMIVSIVAYLTMPDILGVLLSAFLCFCGLVTGLVMALRVLKKRGASAFIPSADPDEENQQPETHTTS